jgi:hypothetical protein
MITLLTGTIGWPDVGDHFPARTAERACAASLMRITMKVGAWKRCEDSD